MPAPAPGLFGAAAPASQPAFGSNLFGVQPAVGGVLGQAQAPALGGIFQQQQQPLPLDHDDATLKKAADVFNKYLPYDAGPLVDILRIASRYYKAAPSAYAFKVGVWRAVPLPSWAFQPAPPLLAL